MTKLNFWLGGVSSLAVAITATHAAADAAPTDKTAKIEEVVVTAQKVSKNLQKSPLSITALSGAALDQANIASAKDLNAAAPGLVVSSTPSNPLAITIRGAGYEGITNNSAQPGVSFNENGVYISDPVSLNAAFLDVDQIEILRGPQGTVLGQNSDGGAINITTVRPTLGKYSGSADLSAGTYDYDRVRFAANVPVGDTAALRATFQQEAHDGFAHATGIPGQPNYPLGNENSFTGRLDFLWKPTAPLTLEVWAESYENNANGDAFKNIYDPNPNPRQLTQDYPSKDKAANDILAARASYNLGWATANLITSYQYGKLSAPEDLDKLDFASGIKVFGVHDIDTINSRVGHSYTQEFDLTSTPGGKLDWIVGAFAVQQSYNETVLEFQYTNPNLVLPTSISNPGAVFATNSLAFESYDTQKLISSSIYAQGTYHFTDTLRLTAGARGTVDQQSGIVAVFFNPAVDLVAKYKAVTGKLELENDFTPQSTGYAMWSSGIKPGGTNLNPGSTVIPTVFKPEENNALEIGLKNQFFDKRLRLNLAAFYNYYKDFQVDSEDPIPFKGGLTNVGNVETEGFEGEMTALLPFNLRLDANLSLMDGKVLSHQQLLDPEIAQTINRLNGGPFVGNDLAERFAAFYAGSGDVYGKTPPKLPPVSAGLSLSHTLYMADGGVFTSHLSFTYREHYDFRIYNNPATDIVPDYRQWNLDFKYRFPTDGWHVDLVITNLTDSASIVARYTDNFGVGAIENYYTPPRQVIVRVGRTF